jgi:hypothetical protein
MFPFSVKAFNGGGVQDRLISLAPMFLIPHLKITLVVL